MTEHKKSIESFMRDYERNSASPDLSAVVAQFADPFLAAGPEGAKVISVPAFAAALPLRRQLFDRSGCQSAKLVSLQSIPLGPRFTLARTTWRIEFAGAETDSNGIDLESSFVIDTGGADWKIVLYLAHQDAIALLQQTGASAPASQ